MDNFLKQFLEYMARGVAALETIAANGGGGFVAADKPATTKPADKPADKPATKPADKPKAEEPQAEPEGPKDPTYTVDEVRAAMKEYRAIEGAPAMLEVLKVHGGGKDALTEVDPAAFHAIMTAVGAAKDE